MFVDLKDLLESKMEYFKREEYETVLEIINAAEKREKDLKQIDEAIEEAQKIKDNQPIFDEKLTSEELKLKGNDYFKNGEYEEAILAYTEAIVKDGDNHLLYSNRAAAYNKLGMKDNGIDDCKKAIELNKNYIKAWIRLGDLYFEDDMDKAEEAYKSGLEIEPENELLKERIQLLKEERLEDEKPPSNERFDIKGMMNNPEFMKMANEMMQNKSKEELEEMMKNLMGNKE